jgi:hypothetical protein
LTAIAWFTSGLLFGVVVGFVIAAFTLKAPL